MNVLDAMACAPETLKICVLSVVTPRSSSAW